MKYNIKAGDEWFVFVREGTEVKVYPSPVRGNEGPLTYTHTQIVNTSDYYTKCYIDFWVSLVR